MKQYHQTAAKLDRPERPVRKAYWFNSRPRTLACGKVCAVAVFMTCLSANAALAQSPQGQSDAQVSGQMRGSISRLQSLEETTMRDLRRDPERDREIQQLLPNYQVTGVGASDRGLKNQAVNTLRGVQLTASGKQTVDRVLGSLSQYRRLPEVRFEVDPDTYNYFVGNPDVVVSLWQSMGISSINLTNVRPYQYRMTNTDGTVSDIYFLHRHRDVNVIYCSGEFKSPLLKHTITAEGVFCLYTKYEKDPATGATFVRHHADAFVAVPNLAVETAAKLISPVSNYIADRNFQEISLFMHTMSLTMERQAGWVQKQAEEMKGLQPEQIREFQHLIYQNYQRGQERFAAALEEESATLR